MNNYERVNYHAGFVPLDLQTARTGDWHKAGDWLRTEIIFYKGTGTDGDDPTITLWQATDNAGTGSKALQFREIARWQGADVQTVAQPTITVQAAGSTYTNTDAHQQLIWIIEIERDMLDIAGGFNYLQAALNDTGGNPQLGCVLYRSEGYVGLGPSAL